MKRIIATMLVCILLLPMLAGCCLSHDWQAATCQAPETCAKCGKTQGEILPHNWEKATCEKSETCTQCGATQGDPLGHEWQAATCEAPETCAACGKTQGEALGHAIRPETIEEGNLLVSTCTNCNTEVRETIDVWEEFADDILLGEWECIGYQTYETIQIYQATLDVSQYYPEEGDHIVFHEDHTFSVQFAGKEITGSWLFENRDETRSITEYGCEINSDATSGRYIFYMRPLLYDEDVNSVVISMVYYDAGSYAAAAAKYIRK